MLQKMCIIKITVFFFWEGGGGRSGPTHLSKHEMFGCLSKHINNSLQRKHLANKILQNFSSTCIQLSLSILESLGYFVIFHEFMYHRVMGSILIIHVFGWKKIKWNDVTCTCKLRTHILKIQFSSDTLTLVKNFQGSLKILEDLHEDPSADL